MPIPLTKNILEELQKRLKVGNRRGVHLNAIPGRSRYKFDLSRLSFLHEELPQQFIEALLTDKPLNFKISWQGNVDELNSLVEDDQIEIVRITKSFENLINQTEAIESEKGINTFGFGYPLLIRRDQQDGKLTVAPILIWSLRIKRTREFNTWTVQRDDDDPIYINEVLINHLQSDSQVVLDQLNSEMLDDGLIDRHELVEICHNILKTINSSVAESELHSIAKKAQTVNKIKSKQFYEKLPISFDNSLIEFGGLFSIFEVQKQNIIEDYNFLLENTEDSLDLEDMEKHFFQPLSSVDTDPSQQEILNSLSKERNILIQGPPGTGKSQSLTAILVNALENNKKTIVVCEKLTALEVLHKALIDKGLGNNCALIIDYIKGRRTVVNSVRERIDNQRYVSNPGKETYDNIVQRTNKIINRINERHIKLNEKVLGEKRWTRLVGEYIKELKASSGTVALELFNYDLKFDSSELNSFLENLNETETQFESFKPFRDRAILREAKLIGDNHYQIEDSLKSDVEDYKGQYSEMEHLLKEYKSEYTSIRNCEFDDQLNGALSLLNSIKALIQENQTNEDFANEKTTTSLLYKVSALFSGTKKNTIQAQKAFRNKYSELVRYINSSSDLFTLENSGSLNENILSIVKISEDLAIEKQSFPNKVDREFRQLEILSNISTTYSTETYGKLKEVVQSLNLQIKENNWTNTSIEYKTFAGFDTDVRNLINALDQYINGDEDVFLKEFNWVNHFNQLDPITKSIVNQLFDHEQWGRSFLVFYLEKLLKKKTDQRLQVYPDDYNYLDQNLNDIKEAQLKYINYALYREENVAQAKFEAAHPYSVSNLYNKRRSKNFKRLSLRNIVKKDIDLFTSFFPIVLTTPDVCSNLFGQRNKYFDIVLFDEASQLRLEDNLPALLKGKQVIIAGDEHQMPPSNYFSKIFEGSIEDEDELEDEDADIFDAENALLSCESLLEFGAELNFEKKYLDFHYRSRHPYLIDFSNHAFYGKRLKPLPNTFEYTPINFIQTRGVYENHVNEIEAEQVLSIIENNIKPYPSGKYPTVGVATLNIAQRDLIKGKIYERRKLNHYKDFNDKMESLENEGFFVKNLENIQGDERDIIILSTTYGCNREGKFYQRFGPINQKKGYKLLNVIITRAKYKVYVCTSIPEDEIAKYRFYLDLEKANNKRAVFYAYLAYAKAVSQGNEKQREQILTALLENTNKSPLDVHLGELESPFEEEVYNSLIDEFGTDNLILQYPVSGFRIDIVYDPKVEGFPKIAIECDGAAYHSSREAYLYDRYRQKILEDQGFVFHRIWSTDWFRNTAREEKKLISFIESIKEKGIQIESTEDLSHSFNDEIEFITEANTPITDEDVKPSRQAINNVKEREKSKFFSQQTLFSEEDKTTSEVVDPNRVKVFSHLKIRFVNQNKVLDIQIVDKQLNQIEKSNGLQKVNSKSPVAIALIDKKQGDVVKIGNLDKYVEILEVQN